MSDPKLTPGEVDLLIDGLSDDVAFVWVLIHLGIRANPPPRPDWIPSDLELSAAFASLRRLVEAGLMCLGRIEYVDGGPPGRLAPVRHVAEEFDVVVGRVGAAVRDARDETDWAFSCWAVNTDRGDAVARRTLDREQGG